MESESDLSESNLLTVKEMLFDEDKIITYISLSKDLCVHVNISKMLLHQVVQNIRKEKPKLELNVNYLISGLSTNNEARMTICPVAKLMELKKKFKIVYFEHIYSISRGSVGVNNTTYLLVNNFNDYSLCLGSVKNSACIKHTPGEINNLKSANLKVSEVSLSKPSDTPHKKIKAEITKTVSTGSNSHHLEEDKIEPSNNDIKLPSKVVREETSPKKEINPTLKQKNQKVNSSKTQKGIAGFFNKASLVSTKKNVPEKINGHGPEISENNIKEEKMEIDENESKTLHKNKSNTKTNNVNKNDKSPEKEANDENNKSNSNSKNKMLNQIKRSSKVDKKRKRVLHVSDSESEIESEHEKEVPSISPESDDEIPSTPMANNIKITSGLVNPKKKRKIIDKTYQDNEGYILTKKVEVYESCSEEESTNDDLNETKVKKELSPKNNIKQKNTKKKLPSPTKGKQVTLTNFFKRK